MQVLALLLSLWFAIQNYSEGCTIICKPCEYACGIRCNGTDCICENCICDGVKGCYEECPPGTFSIRQWCKYLLIFCFKTKDITLLHIFQVFDYGYRLNIDSTSIKLSHARDVLISHVKIMVFVLN